MAGTDPSAWLEQLLRGLESAGPEAAEALRYISKHGTKFSVHDQPTGARWTADRRIEVSPRYLEHSADHPYAIALVIHEVRHLQQGPLTALSVYGELDAWQLQFRYLKSTLGRYHDDPARNAVIESLMSLPLSWDRVVLQKARELMQEYAGRRYRIDLLPLYPIPAETLFRVTGQQPRTQEGQL